jgi:hypothetical protein
MRPQHPRGRVGNLAPKGPKQISPGQRPGTATINPIRALKGRYNRVRAVPCAALSGLLCLGASVPRALPWADLLQPLRGKDRNGLQPGDDATVSGKAAVRSPAYPISLVEPASDFESHHDRTRFWGTGQSTLRPRQQAKRASRSQEDRGNEGNPSLRTRRSEVDKSSPSPRGEKVPEGPMRGSRIRHRARVQSNRKAV